MRLVAAVGRMLLVGMVVLGFGLLAVFGLADLEVWFFVAFISGAVTGLVLSIKRPANALGWTFLAFGSLGVLNAGCYVAAVSQVAQAGPQDLGAIPVLAAWFSQTTWVIILALATVFPLLLFPEGLQSRRWRPVLWLAVAATTVISLSAALAPRLQDETLGISVDNPIAPAWLGWMPEDPENNPVSNIAFIVLGVSVLVAALGLGLRFRRARGVERQQLRWFALAATFLAIAITLDSLLSEAYSDSAFANAFLPLTLAFIPVACGIAITRHGLYEIDRILSRTLSYAVVTGLMLATYAVVVTSVSQLLPGSNTLAVATATLVAAAVFRPLLRRIQDLVDRRFNRARYDAVREVDEFAARLRDSVDPDVAVADLSDVVQRTLQPTAVGLWTIGVDR